MNSSALCRHFGICGGCAHQDMPADDYRACKRGLIVDALARASLGDVEIAPLVEIGPFTRRRASFKAAKANGVVRVGFHAAASHDIVDMRECRILTQALFRLVAGLREMAADLLPEGGKAEFFVSETDNGADVGIRSPRRLEGAAIGRAPRWADRLGLARLTLNGEVLAGLAPASTTLGKAQVVLPPGVFLQPSQEGEAALQALVREGVEGARAVADLFAGCGTFTLVLAEKARVHAVEMERAALEALAAGARGASGLKPVSVEPRDLFRHPLGPAELQRFDAVVLDPPRVGAAAQAKELAKTGLRRVVYVSCNPQSFARDARTLVDGGFALSRVVPVDQFLWSSHIELVAYFSRV